MSSYLKTKLIRGPVNTHSLKSGVICHTLKKKHNFWYPFALGLFKIISEHSFTNKVNKSIQKCL